MTSPVVVLVATVVVASAADAQNVAAGLGLELQTIDITPMIDAYFETYAADADALIEVCTARGVALQTIKSVARRRWQDDSQPRFSWYEPLRDEEAIRRAVHFVLDRPGLFLNSSSDATLLKTILDAASESSRAASPRDLEADAERFGIEALFVPGGSQGI